MKKGELEVDGKKIKFLLRIAFFIAFGTIVMSIFLGHDGSERIAMAKLNGVVKSLSPNGWPVLSEGEVDKGTFVGYAISKKSQVGLMESVEEIESIINAAGFREKHNMSSKAHYRKVFCRQSIAVDVEIYNNDEGEAIVDSGAYWSSQKDDSRYCR
ncbi:hypothetical protein KM539_06250 [Xanthomonas translucens pv. poae]|uniref:hypothetical protein n=1 Tax=Xanthomonas graminis TaxID=3390026 RepID=UPI001112F9D3|nr:hypothetical protein [Xanthomonas translucens]UKE63069.1 hypothetical protein KM539_06250 [Xanthomonas translucens pv. poae]